MPLRIVEHYPRVGVWRRIGRNALFVVGPLLTLGGILVAIGMLFLLASLVATIIGGDWEDFETDDEEDVNWLGLLGVPVAGGVGLILGLRWVRGRRRLVLFLRRFGFRDSSQALTYAVGTAVGRRWRVVTLDDALLAPVGVKQRVRRALRLVNWAGALLVVLLIIYIGWLTSSTNKSLPGTEGNPLPDPFGCLTVITIIALVGLLIGVAVLVAAVGAVSLLSWGSYRAVKRAERAKELKIQSESQVSPMAFEIARRARRLFAPRLVVLRVAANIWKQTVQALAGVAAVVLIDVSEPTANLIWEIDFVRHEVELPWLLVGRRDRLEAVACGNGEHEKRLARLLDDQEVLAYASEERADMKRFAASLAARLECLAESARRPKP